MNAISLQAFAALHPEDATYWVARHDNRRQP